VVREPNFHRVIHNKKAMTMQIARAGPERRDDELGAAAAGRDDDDEATDSARRIAWQWVEEYSVLDVMHGPAGGHSTWI